LSSLAIACIAFGCTLAGTLLGMFAQRALPRDHMSGESKEAVKLGLTLIATLTALVLGLLVATTKGTYDTQSAAVKELASNAVLLDRVLDRYGSETKEARSETKEAREVIPSIVKTMLEHMWPENSSKPADLTTKEVRIAGDALFDKISALKPETDTQRLFKARAMEIMISGAQTRQRLITQKESSIPTPFLVVLGFWLTFLFTCYGLLAPRNVTVFLVLIVCMLSVAGALFIVLEMDRPFDGIMRVPSAPLREALSRLGE
jgi:hypothetical protein